MARSQSLRTGLVADLRTLRDLVGGVRSVWDAGTYTTQIFDNGGPFEQGHWRKRTPDELPENDLVQVNRTVDDLRRIAAYAAYMADKLEGNRQARWPR